MQMSHRRCRIMLAIMDQDTVGEEVMVVNDSDIVGLDNASGASDIDNSP